MPVATAISLTYPKRAYAGQVVPLQVEFVTTATLAARLLAGTAYTSLTTGPLPAAVASGQVLTLVQNPSYSVQVTASAPAIAGATSITVNSFTPISAFSPGAALSYAVDPSTIEIVYSPGKGSTPVAYFFPTTSGGIVKVATGLYLLDIDTTAGANSKAGSWTGAVTATGAIAYQPFNFTVSEAPV